MKKSIFTLVYFIITNLSYAQHELGLSGVTREEIGKKINEGTEVVLDEIYKDELGTIQARLADNFGRTYKVRHSLLDKITWHETTDIDAFWKLEAVQAGTYKQLASKGKQLDLRLQLVDASNNLLLVSEPLLYDNDYLEEYIYSKLIEFIPQNAPNGLPMNFNVILVSNPEPEGIFLPNGILMLNSGLLALLESEEELQAILIQKLANYLLDHYVFNYNKQLSKNSDNDLLGLTALFAGIGTEVLIASRNNVTLGGQISQSAAIIASILTDSVKYDLGTNYTREQTSVADEISRKLLKIKGLQPEALDRILTRIKDYYSLKQDVSKVEEISYRINKVNFDASATNQKDLTFCRRISGIYTLDARANLTAGNYQRCMDMIDKKIDLEMARQEDYLLKAACLSRNCHDASNVELAYRWILKAELLNETPPDILHYRKGLALMQMDRFAEAETALTTYEQLLQNNGAEKQEINQIQQLIFQCRKMNNY